MEPVVQRTRHARGRRAGRATLAQTFEFGGDTTAEAITGVLRIAPLVGPHSIFGDRRGREERDESAGRRLRGFSPALGFRFDLELAEREPGVVVATFSQPDRRTPYLAGEAVWFVSDGPDGARLDEEINTERAASFGAAPLAGPRLSVRRALFFRVGHAAVMAAATERIAGLVAR